MKKIFTAIVAMMLAVPSFAQYSSGGFELDKENLYYGVRFGATVANLGGDIDKDPLIDTGAKTGLTLAGVVGLRLSETTPVFLESGLYYTQRGGKNVSYNNMEIPLLIKYGIKATDEIAVLPFVGPYIARACWGEAKLVDGIKVGTFDEDKWSALERVNWGFKIGCGAEYNMLYLEVGYQIGVNDISKNGNYTAHSNALFANFGVNF